MSPSIWSPRVLLVGDVGGLEPLLPSAYLVDRASSLRGVSAQLASAPVRAIVVTQVVRGRGEAHAGDWVLAWVKARYPGVVRILVVDAWTTNPESYEDSGLAHAVVSASLPLSELARLVSAFVDLASPPPPRRPDPPPSRARG